VGWTGWTRARGRLAGGDDARSGSGSDPRSGMLGEVGSGGRGVRVEEGEVENCSLSGIWRAQGLAAGHSGGCSDMVRLDRYPCSPLVFDSVAARCGRGESRVCSGGREERESK